jgi:hypothetical protein
MAIVFEIVNRSGYVVSSEVIDKDVVTIGRAYTNDIVIADDYIDPSHLQIEVSEDKDTFLCIDKNSVNGVYSKKGKKKEKLSRIQNGDLISIGKTQLKISSADIPVAPAIPLSYWETVADFLCQWWVVLLLTAIFSVLFYADVNVLHPLLENKSEKYMELLYFVIAVCLYGAVCAFFGKVFRHDSRFGLYFSLLMCLLIIFYLYDWFASFLSFNLDVSFGRGLNNLFYAVGLAVLIHISFRFATHFKPISRFLISAIVPCLVLVNIVVDWVQKEDSFHNFPPYHGLVFHESLRWTGQKSTDEFLQSADSLYSLAADKNNNAEPEPQ